MSFCITQESVVKHLQSGMNVLRIHTVYDDIRVFSSEPGT